MTIETRLTVATRLIREAGDLAAGYFARRAALTRETKGPQDFVSVADREVETLIRTRLAEAFPEDGFLGEESGGGAGERCWVVDPIDGTNNFLRGLPLWGVSIAYAIAGEPVIGLIYLPSVGRLYSAVRGGGAWCEGVPIRVSRANELAQATITVGISRRTSPDLSLPMIETVLRSGTALRCMGTCVRCPRDGGRGDGRRVFRGARSTVGLPGRHFDCSRGGWPDKRGSRTPDVGPRRTIACQHAGAVRSTGAGGCGSTGPHRRLVKHVS